MKVKPESLGNFLVYILEKKTNIMDIIEKIVLMYSLNQIID